MSKRLWLRIDDETLARYQTAAKAEGYSKPHDWIEAIANARAAKVIRVLESGEAQTDELGRVVIR